MFVNLTFTDVLILTNKNATLRYLIMYNLLCYEERSIVGDTYSVCERSLSEEVIGNISMKKLETVANPILRETAGEVRKKKKAGYQENILTDLLEDMDRK